MGLPLEEMAKNEQAIRLIETRIEDLRAATAAVMLAMEVEIDALKLLAQAVAARPGQLDVTLQEYQIVRELESVEVREHFAQQRQIFLTAVLTRLKELERGHASTRKTTQLNAELNK